MAADSIYRVIMGKCCGSLSDIDLDWIFFLLGSNKDNHNVSDQFEFRPD